jgi:hypothetical protein
MTKKRKVLIGVIALVVILFVQNQIRSCSNKTNEDNLKKELTLKEAFVPNKKVYKISATQLQINGPLGDYLKIANSNAEFKFINTSKEFMDDDHIQKWELKVKCERLPKKLEWDIQNLNGNYTSLSLAIVDINGKPISGAEVECASGHDLIDKILTLKNGQEGWVTFNLSKGKAFEQDVLKGWKKFVVNSKIGFVNETISSEANEPVVSSSSDCDEFIAEYEEFVNSYVVILKKYKANPTDASIISEYTKMAAKAVTMKKDAANCNDPKYVTKLLKLNTKITNALSGI